MNDSSETMQNPPLRRYLLGQLSEEEQGRLEERLFTDDTFHHQIEVAEDDLVEAYVSGELSAVERDLFETHFLSTPERLQYLQLTRTLHETFAHATAPADERGPRLESRPSRRSVAPWLAVAASLVISFAVISYLALRLAKQERTANQRLTQQESQLAARETQINQLQSALEREKEQLAKVQQDTARVERPGPSAGRGVLSFILLPDLATRGREAGITTLSLPSPSARAQLHLDTEVASDHLYESYRVVIKNSDGSQIWGADNLQLRAPGQPVIVNPPAGLLQRGDYRITLYGKTTAGAAEDIDDYSFRVVVR